MIDCARLSDQPLWQRLFSWHGESVTHEVLQPWPPSERVGYVRQGFDLPSSRVEVVLRDGTIRAEELSEQPCGSGTQHPLKVFSRRTV